MYYVENLKDVYERKGGDTNKTLKSLWKMIANIGIYGKKREHDLILSQV